MQLKQAKALRKQSMKPVLFEEKKEMEEDVDDIDLSMTRIHCKPFQKKRKYPFHEKVDVNDLDDSLQCIFAETYDIITDILSKIESDKLDKSSVNNQEDEISDDQISDDQINDDRFSVDRFSDDEKIDLYLESPKESRNEREIYVYNEPDDIEIKEEIEEIMALPLTEAEIRKEMEYESNIEMSANVELNEYQEKLIEIIINEFECIYFRSPSSREISIILSKSIEKMKKCEQNGTDKLPKIALLKSRKLTKNQQLLASNTSKNNVVDVLENAEKVVLDYLVFKATKENKSLTAKKDLILKVLMSKLQQNNSLSL